VLGSGKAVQSAENCASSGGSLIARPENFTPLRPKIAATKLMQKNH